MNWQHYWKAILTFASLLVTNIATRWVINGEPCPPPRRTDCVRGHHHRRHLVGVPEGQRARSRENTPNPNDHTD